MNIRLDGKTLFFCVGATKAGTSWLHSQMQGHPQVHFRTIKELHYFNLTTPQHFTRTLKANTAEIEAARGRLRLADADKRGYAAARLQDLQDWRAVLQAGPGGVARYAEYLTEGSGARPVVGDMTPAYGLLPAETLTRMAGLTQNVRFLYLMRDPVERLWSHVRMVCVRADRDSFAGGSVKMLRSILDGETGGEIDGILRRGDYAAILDRLTGALPQPQLLVQFYEHMFQPEGLLPLSGFLEVTPFAPKVAARVHAGVPLTLPDDLRLRARAFLAGQYDAVAARLGPLPAAWAV